MPSSETRSGEFDTGPETERSPSTMHSLSSESGQEEEAKTQRVPVVQVEEYFSRTERFPDFSNQQNEDQIAEDEDFGPPDTSFSRDKGFA